MPVSPKRSGKAARPYREAFGSFPAGSGRKKEPVWLEETRRRAFERFRAVGFPQRKTENWRSLPLEPVLATVFHPSGARASVDEACARKYFSNSGESCRLVFADGVFQKKLSSCQGLPAGVVLESLFQVLEQNPDAMKSYLDQDYTHETNPFTVINGFSFNHGIFVSIPAGTVMTDTLHLLFLNAGHFENPAVFYPRVVVAAGDGARVNIVSQYGAVNDDCYLMNGVTDIHLGRDAEVHWAHLHQAGEESIHMTNSRVFLGDGSRFQMNAFQRGGRISRHEIQAYLRGRRAFCSLEGLSLLSGNSYAAHLGQVIHEVPECTSRQTFKSVLSGKAQSEFYSLVHVFKDASKSDSSQMNRNLLLSDQAQAWSRPQLKIFTDDVVAVHGSATGHLEEEAVFYLRSRGISPQAARWLLACGFAEEMIAKIPDTHLKSRLEALVREDLGTALGVKP